MRKTSLQAMQAKRQILASRISTAKMLNNERSLEHELSRFFKKLKKQVLKELETYYSEDFMFQAQADLILSPIFESQKEYYEIILKHIRKEYKNGISTGKRLVNLSRKKTLGADKSSTILPLSSVFHRDELFGYNEWSANELYTRSFKASEGTMNRVDGQINDLLSKGYESGEGINKVGDTISKRFDQLADWESRRIARTEIHNAHNRGTMDIYNKMNVEYIQWGAALDDRTRDTHADINGEIIALGDTFSNGLQYPGDTSGDIEEWINCRCSNMPFIMPEGYVAPSFSPFRESDLVSIESPDLSDVVDRATEEAQEKIPTEPTTIEQVQQTPNSMIRGEYETYTEIDKVNNSKVTVYKYENGFELAINENAILTHEEVVAHINSLPEPLRNLSELERINIKDWQSANGGVYRPAFHDINIYAHSNSTKVIKLDTLTHELAHARDFNGGLRNNLSLKEGYEKIFKADNKLHVYTTATGRKRTPKKFPTTYAGRSYVKYGKDFKKRLKIWEKGTKTMPKPTNQEFVEDFAESTKLYLNPSTHEQFVKDFPNRAKYLEGLYGKPSFDKTSPLYKELIKEGLM